MASDERVDAIVVGAGLAGLAAARRLADRFPGGVRVVEGSERVGGCVRTVRDPEGRLFETGPNSLRGHCPAITALARAAGLEGARLAANADAAERWIWHGGTRKRLPSGPKGLLSTPLLSPRGRARLLAEPLRRPWAAPTSETTIAAFLQDRVGAEALEAFGAPFTTGVFAGEPEDIGVEAFGPFQLAAEAGGLARGLCRIRAAGGGSGLWTFKDGLGSLTDALAARLDVRLGVPAVGFQTVDGLHRLRLGDGTELAAPRVVFATPAEVTGRLLGIPPLVALRSATVASVSLALSLADFAAPPTGFGMLIARQSPLPPVLGVVFASRVFQGRAPDGEIILAAICGGTRHAAALPASDDALVAEVVGVLARAFGYRGAPRAARVARWRDAIPQVPPGHIAAVRAAAVALPRGLALAGSGLGGVSLEQVAASGLAAADRVSAR